MEEIGAALKIVPSRDFLFALREAGRESAGKWLAEEFAAVGLRSSLDTKHALVLRLDGFRSAVHALKPGG